MRDGTGSSPGADERSPTQTRGLARSQRRIRVRRGGGSAISAAALSGHRPRQWSTQEILWRVANQPNPLPLPRAIPCPARPPAHPAAQRDAAWATRKRAPAPSRLPYLSRHRGNGATDAARQPPRGGTPNGCLRPAAPLPRARRRSSGVSRSGGGWSQRSPPTLSSRCSPASRRPEPSRSLSSPSRCGSSTSSLRRRRKLVEKSRRSTKPARAKRPPRPGDRARRAHDLGNRTWIPAPSASWSSPSSPAR